MYKMPQFSIKNLEKTEFLFFTFMYFSKFLEAGLKISEI